MPPTPGSLYIVATPIGNLEDLTFRALRTLREVDVIAAEDTRRTAKLLAHYEVRKPLISIREHNEVREAPRIIDRLTRGERIALVSDAGTPGIADPGAKLVAAVRKEGLLIIPIPGASAVAAALSVAGVTESEFVFMGFPPPIGADRRKWFDRLAMEPRAVVFFEAPHRIHRTLEDAVLYLGERQIIVGREITKINENFTVYPNKTERLPLTAKGEFCLVVHPAVSHQKPMQKLQDQSELIGRLTECGLFKHSEIINIVSSSEGIPVRSAKKLLKKHNYSLK